MAGPDPRGGEPLAPLITACVAVEHEEKRPTPGRPTGGLDIPLHAHPFCQVDIFHHGGLELHRLGAPPVRPPACSGVLLPPLQAHGYRILSPGLQTSLKFRIHPRHWLRFTRVREPIALPAWYPGLAQEAVAAYRVRGALWADLAAGAAAVFLARWLADARQPAVAAADGWNGRLAEAVSRLALHPHRYRSVAALARGSGASTDHFCRRFQAWMGVAPRRFILEQRMHAAALLLVQGDVAVKQVAEEAGYASVHGFTRAFSAVFGTGPAAYARRPPPTG